MDLRRHNRTLIYFSENDPFQIGQRLGRYGLMLLGDNRWFCRLLQPSGTNMISKTAHSSLDYLPCFILTQGRGSTDYIILRQKQMTQRSFFFPRKPNYLPHFDRQHEIITDEHNKAGQTLWPASVTVYFPLDSRHRLAFHPS